MKRRRTKGPLFPEMLKGEEAYARCILTWSMVDMGHGFGCGKRRNKTLKVASKCMRGEA